MVDSQVMLITGTSSGIGRFLAEYYSTKKNFQVIGCSRRKIESKCEVEHFCIDVTNEKSVKDMFKTIRTTYGRLDILINSASISAENYALLTPVETVQTVLETNVTGTIICCREASRLMQKKKFGRIVNISSVHVPLATPGTSTYGASKAAVTQFSKVMAREVFHSGITVNVLALSAVRNSGMVDNLPEETLSSILEATVSKKYLEVKDITHTLDFFISEKASMVTAQTLYLGGV